MSYKLRCLICKTEHKATAKNFPLVFYERREVFEGKGKDRKSLGIKPVVVGHGCKKCDRTHRRNTFIKQHGIKNEPGQSMSEAIRRKADELKLQNRIIHQDKPKEKGWDKIKNWTKDRFFKKRGRT